jgi:hypothetical protein
MHGMAGDALVGLSKGGPVAVPVLFTLAWVAVTTAISAPFSLRLYRRRYAIEHKGRNSSGTFQSRRNSTS